MNGLTASLTKAGVGPYRFDIKGSRRITQSWLTYDSGVSVAKKMINDGFHPKAWVVALGSNDFYFFKRKVLSPKKEIEAFLDVVGHKRHVVWFTIWTRRASEYYKTFNSALFEMERRNSRFHVLDWAATAKPHPEWLKAKRRAPEDARRESAQHRHRTSRSSRLQEIRVDQMRARQAAAI